jgi:hypothetical protein
MVNMDALKENLHSAIEAETSAEILFQLEQILTKKYPLVPEGVEKRIDGALADIAAGRVYTQKEFEEISAVARKTREEKYR